MIPMTNFTDIRASKGIKFCHLNIRSIMNKIDQFKMHVERSTFDIITLSETWLTEEYSSSLLNMDGYQILRSDRLTIGPNGTKKGGGLLTFDKSNLNFVSVNDVSKNSSCQDVEIQRLELCSTVQKNIVLFNIYRPPKGSVSNCLDIIGNALEDEANLHLKEIILMGDVNLNFSAKSNPDTKKLIHWQNRLGLNQLIKTSTRSSKRSATTIDLIFTNMESCDTSGVLNLHVSDHQPVFVIKKKTRDNRKKIVFTGCTYVSYSKVNLSDALTNAEKLRFREEKDPNKCWDLMEAFLEKFLDEHCPIKTFRSK